MPSLIFNRSPISLWLYPSVMYRLNTARVVAGKCCSIHWICCAAIRYKASASMTGSCTSLYRQMPLSKSTLSELDLIKGCILNDRRMQELLYKQYCSSMMVLCKSYAKNDEDAIEVLQDGFLKIFQQIDKYDANRSSLYTWMRTIMVRTAVDFLRKQNRKSVAFDDSYHAAFRYWSYYRSGMIKGKINIPVLIMQ